MNSNAELAALIRAAAQTLVALAAMLERAAAAPLAAPVRPAYRPTVCDIATAEQAAAYRAKMSKRKDVPAIAYDPATAARMERAARERAAAKAERAAMVDRAATFTRGA